MSQVTSEKTTVWLLGGSGGAALISRMPGAGRAPAMRPRHHYFASLPFTAQLMVKGTGLSQRPHGREGGGEH